MLEKDSWHAYPDFYSKELGIVMDAKYKHAPEINKISSEDRMQIISYMHILGLDKGIFLYPSSINDIKCKKLIFYYTKETEECIFQYKFNIPHGDDINNMQQFIIQISKSEKIFKNYWQNFTKIIEDNK